MHLFSWVLPSLFPSWWQTLNASLSYRGLDDEEVEGICTSSREMSDCHSSTESTSRRDGLYRSIFDIFDFPDLVWYEAGPSVTQLDHYGHASSSACPCLATSRPVPTQSTSTIRAGCLLPVLQRPRARPKLRAPGSIRGGRDGRRDGFVLPDPVPSSIASFQSVLDNLVTELSESRPEHTLVRLQSSLSRLPTLVDQCEVDEPEYLPIYSVGDTSGVTLPPVYEYYDPHPLYPIAHVSPPETMPTPELGEARRVKSKTTAGILGNGILSCVGRIGRMAKNAPQAIEERRDKYHQRRARNKFAWLNKRKHMSEQRQLLRNGLTGG